jgi:hypothetical protein
VAVSSTSRVVFGIPYQQNANAGFTLGTIAMQIFVDSPNSLSFQDGTSSTSLATWSISGYLLPLTPGASC